MSQPTTKKCEVNIDYGLLITYYKITQKLPLNNNFYDINIVEFTILDLNS